VHVPPNAPRVGRYALLNTIGEGGFGVVRRAVHMDTGVVVAVKVMDKHQLRLNNMSPQVKREIAVLTVLRHPNIVAGYEVLTSRARIFVVMEYVDGGELFTLLARHRRLDEPTVKYLFYQLLDGLHYCHQRGVYHRDLKVRRWRRAAAPSVWGGGAAARCLSVGVARAFCATVCGGLGVWNALPCATSAV